MSMMCIISLIKIENKIVCFEKLIFKLLFIFAYKKLLL